MACERFSNDFASWSDTINLECVNLTFARANWAIWLNTINTYGIISPCVFPNNAKNLTGCVF